MTAITGHAAIRYGSIALLSALLAVGIVFGALVIHHLQNRITKSKTVQSIQWMLSADMVSLSILCFGEVVTLGAGTWVFGDVGCSMTSVLIRTASSVGIMSRFMLTVHRFRLLIQKENTAQREPCARAVWICWLISAISASLVEGLSDKSSSVSFRCEYASGWLPTTFDVIIHVLPSAITVLLLTATYFCQRNRWTPGLSQVNPVTGENVDIQHTSTIIATRDGNDESAGLSQRGLKVSKKLVISIGLISCILFVAKSMKLASQYVGLCDTGCPVVSFWITVVCYTTQPVFCAWSFKFFRRKFHNIFGRKNDTMTESSINTLQTGAHIAPRDSDIDMGLPHFLQGNTETRLNRLKSISTISMVSANDIDITSSDLKTPVTHVVEIHHKIRGISCDSSISIISTPSLEKSNFGSASHGIPSEEAKGSVMMTSTSSSSSSSSWFAPFITRITTLVEHPATVTTSSGKRASPMKNNWVSPSSFNGSGGPAVDIKYKQSFVNVLEYDARGARLEAAISNGRKKGVSLGSATMNNYAWRNEFMKSRPSEQLRKQTPGNSRECRTISYL